MDSMLLSTTKKRIGWNQYRWLIAIIGLIMMVVGQAVISRSEPPSTKPTQLGLWLNNTLHLGLPSVDNVINGLPILIVGCFLVALVLRGLRLLPVENGLERKKPFAFNMVIFAVPAIFFAIALFGTTLWSLVHLEYKQWMLVGWLTSVVFFLIAIAIWDHRRGIHLSPDLLRKDILWLLGLMMFGLVLGVYRLQAMPDSLMGDEGYFWTSARDIAEGLFKPPIFAVGVYTFPVFSTYLQAWILKNFGISLWGWRFSSVISGVVTVLPLYLLARDAFNRKVAIASSIALIMSPYFLAFTRLGYISIQSLFITTLAVYWLYIGLNRDSHLYLFLAGCAAGLGFYTFFSARIGIPIALSYIGFMWLSKRIKFRQAAFAISLVGIGTLLIAGPYFAYGTSHDASGMSYKIFESLFFNIFYGKQYFSDTELYAIAPPFSINGNTLFYNPKIYLVLIANGLIRTWLAFQKPGLITEHFISSSLTGTVGVIFFLIGLGIIIFKFKQPRSMLLLLWFFGVVFGLSALNTVPPRHTHMVSIIPALALFTGLGLYTITGALKAIFNRLAIHRNTYFGIGIAALIIGGVVDFFYLAPHKYHPQPDQVMSWATLYAKNESFVYIYSNPTQQNFQPYVVTEFRRNIPFSTISVDTLDENRAAINWARKTVIFYPPDLAGKVEPIIKEKWGEQFLVKTFYSTDGIPVLTAGINTSFVFVRDQSPLMILVDSYLHPPFLILFTILIWILVLFIILPNYWVNPVSNIIKRLADWVIGPATQEKEKEEQAIFDESAFDQKGETLPSEPPEWADNFFHVDQPERPPRLQFEFIKVNKTSGKDLYIRIHIPPTKVRGFRFLKEVKIALPALRIPNPLILSLAILSAIFAQMLISSGNSISGIVLYLLCFTGLFIWFRLNPKWSGIFGNQLQISPRAEKIIICTLIGLSAFLRFYDLFSRAYGLNIDDVRWTLQSWYSTILMLNKGDLLSNYHFFPVGFWIRSVFLRIFGINFLSARIESATLSLFNILLLYLLVRKLFRSSSIALLSATLYSFSFVVLSVAHRPIGTTSTQVWITSTLYFLISSLQERKWWQFQVTGILLSLGLLTSWLFLPTLVLVILYLIGIGIIEIVKKRTPLRSWLQYMFMIIWPIFLIGIIYTQVPANIQRIPIYDTLAQFFKNGIDFIGLYNFLSTNTNQLFTTMFSRIVVTDSLLSWDGPFINPLLLPFVLIGFFNNLRNFNHEYNGIIPLWLLFYILLGPIAMNTVSPKTLNFAMVPLMIWGALGLWTFLGMLRAWFVNRRFNLAVPFFIFSLSVITLSDYHIFVSGSPDSNDQVKLRELSDLSSKSADKVPMILYAYENNSEDSLAIESNIIMFSMAGRAHIGLDSENHFNQIKADQILYSLQEFRNLSTLDLFFDKTTDSPAQGKDSLDIMLKCYPDAELSASGQFYDVYHFDAMSLTHPICFQDVPPTLTYPSDDAILTFGAPLTLSWDNHGVRATSYLLTLERRTAGNYWIEVEKAFTGPHWISSSEFAEGFSDKGFLLDEWQAGNAQSSLAVSDPGEYRFWIRSYKRRVNDQHNFISINGKQVPFSSDENPLDEWVWDDLGIYSLSKGPLPLILSRTYGKDEEYSVFIDSLLITADTIAQPDKINIWEIAMNIGEVTSASNAHIFTDDLPEGEYRWKVRIFEQDSLVDANGVRGLETSFASFKINR